MKRKDINMCEGPMLKNIILYTIPIMLSGILQLLFNAADLMVVGRFGNPSSVGAVGATTALVNLIVNLFVGVSTGTGVVVSNAIGAHDDERVSRAVHTAIPTALISGIAVSILGIFISGPFLSIMGTPPEQLPLSTLYLKVYFAGAVFLMLYNFGAAILRATGDTRSPLIFLTIAGALNVCLNLIFVILFDMDVAGVALATVISQAVSAILTVITLMKRTDACRLILKKMHIYAGPLKKMLMIGIPSGIQGSLFSISNVIVQSSVNSFGAITVNGTSAATSAEGFLYIALNAFYHAALNFVGQNVGAKKYDRVKRVFYICIACATVVGAIGALLMNVFDEQLLSLYLQQNENTAESIRAGCIKLFYICTFYFLCGFMEISTACIRAMGHSFKTMIVTVIGVCGFRIAWVYLIFSIPKYHTLEGLFASYPISWLITFLVQAIIFFAILKKEQRHLLLRQ